VNPGKVSTLIPSSTQTPQANACGNTPTTAVTFWNHWRELMSNAPSTVSTEHTVPEISGSGREARVKREIRPERRRFAVVDSYRSALSCLFRRIVVSHPPALSVQYALCRLIGLTKTVVGDSSRVPQTPQAHLNAIFSILRLLQELLTA
jgi:hypothetical protein